MSEVRPIHPLSGVVPLAALDLWAIPGTNTSIKGGKYYEYRPFSALSARGDQLIEINVNNAIDEYTDFSISYLALKARIFLTKDDKSEPEEADWNEVVPCNYLMHSMFKQVEVFLQNKPITLAPQTYHYTSYFQALMAFSDDAKNSVLGTAGWEENPKDLQKLIMPGNKKGKQGREFELLGRLHIDLAFQPKYLPGGVNFRLRLSPEDPKFIFENKAGSHLRIDINDATFYAYKHIVTDVLLEAHSKALSISPIKIPFVRDETKVLQIPQGSIDCILDNVICGQLPRKMFLAMVKADAFNGSYAENPQYFNHFNINFLASYVDGKQIPEKAYTPNFKNGNCTREYLMLMQTLNQNNTDPYFRITKDEYANKGFTIFPFNYSPDFCSGPGLDGHCNPIIFGNVRLHFRFDDPLPKPINVLLFCEFDSLIEIDENRNVLTSYN